MRKNEIKSEYNNDLSTENNRIANENMMKNNSSLKKNEILKEISDQNHAKYQIGPVLDHIINYVEENNNSNADNLFSEQFLNNNQINKNETIKQTFKPKLKKKFIRKNQSEDVNNNNNQLKNIEKSVINTLAENDYNGRK